MKIVLRSPSCHYIKQAQAIPRIGDTVLFPNKSYMETHYGCYVEDIEAFIWLQKF